MKLATKTADWTRATWILVMLVALAGLVNPTRGLADVMLSFDPLNGIITETVPAETLTVAITVDAGADTLKGFSMVLEFDPTYVQPISVTPGPLMSQAPCGTPVVLWLNSGAVGDSIAVDGAALGCDGMVGSGNMVEIQFVGVPSQYGISPLACRDIRLRNQYNDVLSFLCTPGTIEHRPVIISTESATWGRVKALYR
ncbi:hypothetical protein K8I85_10335 [bacterium]|nr:hypothetical protein [bacterium]